VGIDHEAAEFPYLQLAAILRDRISTGRYPAGRKIPSLIALEDEFGLSNMTVRRAVSLLADEGLLVKVPGRGTFVAGSPRRLARPVTVSCGHGSGAHRGHVGTSGAQDAQRKPVESGSTRCRKRHAERGAGA
jgi:DNA-binding FadR family transcriptional regulator